MASRLLVFVFISAFLLVVDYYVFSSFRSVWFEDWSKWRKGYPYIYWGLSLLFWVLFIGGLSYGEQHLHKGFRNIAGTLFLGTYMGKIFASVFFLLEDISRAGRWLAVKLLGSDSSVSFPERAEFLAQSALVVATVPIATMSFGILSGAHDYQVRKVKLKINQLPSGLKGLRIVQISDIHSGSFWNKTAVKGGVELILSQRPDIVFFTGDLVNNVADEMKGWADVFGRIKAPLGVYSVLGNHDYGDYVRWDSLEKKEKNLDQLKSVHHEMGWKLLNNKSEELKIGSDRLQILGVENYGVRGHFAKYGKLDQALSGLENGIPKLLLSHDPSHWEAQVIDSGIDVMFAGHTHGMQFGIENEWLKWSPVQYMYPQWAGLYQSGDAQLYVNRGFGYIGYPGRIGILPEITLLELEG